MPARAQDGVKGDRPGPEGDALTWDPAWPKFRTGEWIATGLGIGALLGSRLAPPASGGWQGGTAFDESARDVLRVEGQNGRRWARDFSDIGLVINESLPYFDAIVIAGWYRRSAEVAWQQGLITAEVLAVTAGLQAIVSSVAGRERPYVRNCGDGLPAESRDCTVTDRYRSFYSGHSSQSFAGAAVACMHHAYVPLYGGGAADNWACVGALGVAAATALMRVRTDVHYVTDVATGALVGGATGVLLPWLLHYRFGPLEAGAEARDWSFSVVPTGLGANGVLVF